LEGLTYCLETFGCQMNVLDSQLVEGQLRACGMSPVQAYRDADVILFNTCSVRQHAEDKVLSRLGYVRRYKQKRPEVIIGVIGCMAERMKEKLFSTAPYVDLLCGPGELHRLPALLADVHQRHERVTALAGSRSRRTEVLQRALEYDSLEALDLSRTPGPEDNVLQSYVRVQRGCDKFCTFCVVPFTRGPERSRPPSHIIDEAKMLVARGCREITLLGQTVNSYLHQENGRPLRFAQLLERVHQIEGLDRLRFVTSFPADWDEDIFRVMRDCPRVCSYLHIPAQSGSERILKAMRRGYTAAEYLKLMDAARKYVPDISLAGDFVVGFCGESEADFAATVDMVRRVEYKSLFVFKYSPRPGTVADRNNRDDVPNAVKARRNNELLALQSEISLKQKQALVGRTVEVLVEGYSKAARKAVGQAVAVGQVESSRPAASPATSPPRPQDCEHDRGHEASADKSHQLVGRTPGDLITVFDGEESHIGALVRVRVADASPLTLFGRIEAVLSPSRNGLKPVDARSPTLLG